MNDHSTGYRAFPEFITHPAHARRFTPEEFVQDAPSACAGHAGTVIWYVEAMSYILEIRFDSHRSAYVHSICTFTPRFGMDVIDGEFAQDVEAWALREMLGYESPRLETLPAGEIHIQQYLRLRGYAK
jgi:hypothetical protein